MTKERAIELCQGIKEYLCAGNPIWDTEKIREAMDMAIEALSTQPEIIKCKKCKNCSEDKMYKQWWCHGHLVKADGFCAWAERRTNNGN